MDTRHMSCLTDFITLLLLGVIILIDVGLFLYSIISIGGWRQ